MSRQHHYLKTLPEHFIAVENRSKTFEVRKNDRDFKKGDILHLQEFIPPKTYTLREVGAEVVYLLDDEKYCKKGYVIMGIAVCEYEEATQ